MPTTLDRLIGVRAKIERAKEHIHELNIQIRAFQDNNRNCLDTEIDPQTGEKVYRVKFRTPIPTAIPLSIGDAAHNLRSALDHLAWQLVEANGQTPTRYTAYPVFDTAEKYKASSLTKVHGISPHAEQVIEGTQPYHAGYDGIRKLNELDNFDKHRLLIVAAVQLGDIAFGIDPQDLIRKAASGTASVTFAVPHVIASPPSGSCMLQDGDEFCRVSPECEHEAKAGFTFQIAICEPGVVQHEPALVLLSKLTKLVEDIVNRFEPFL